MLRWSEVSSHFIRQHWRELGLVVELVVGDDIPGSHWGAPEAGLIHNTLYVRADTPLHSALHEAGHWLCMTPERRSKLHTNAGGTALEECAVCYLQILMSTWVPPSHPALLIQDMDEWGYSFRLGTTEAWFRDDAADARQWLRQRAISPQILALLPS